MILKQYILYMTFAGIAIGINIGSQFLVKIGVSPHLPDVMIYRFNMGFIVQLLTGTILGFLFKFIIDKFYIFEDRNIEVKRTLRQLIIYMTFAVFTTLIFWGIEILFKISFVFKNSDLLGGFIGLFIGYTTKFILDRRFVFGKI